MKRELKKRISKIHAVKANKTRISSLAEASYQEQERLKLIIDALGEDDDFTKIIQEINNWANQEPFVTDSEINEIM